MIEFTVELDQEEFEQPLNLSFSPDYFTVRIMPAVYINKKIPPGLTKKETLKYVEKVFEARKKKVEGLKKYLLNHWEAIQNHHNRDLALPEDMIGMGVIESNIDKVFADRFKKRGIRLSKEGAENLAQIILADRNNDLEKWFFCMNWDFKKEDIKQEIEKAKQENTPSKTSSKKKTASYLEVFRANITALEDPDLSKITTSGTVI